MNTSHFRWPIAGLLLVITAHLPLPPPPPFNVCRGFLWFDTSHVWYFLLLPFIRLVFSICGPLKIQNRRCRVTYCEILRIPAGIFSKNTKTPWAEILQYFRRIPADNRTRQLPVGKHWSKIIWLVSLALLLSSKWKQFINTKAYGFMELDLYA